MDEICTSCFENHGIKETALRIVDKQNDQVICKSCSKHGYTLSNEELLVIMNQFLLRINSARESRTYIPIQ
jgi:hypothetical protein